MEVHPLEKERLKKLAMVKRGQDAGIPSHIPADAIKKSLKRPMYTKEYLSKIFAHPDTTVKDLKQIEISLYNRSPLNVVPNPEVDEMIKELNIPADKIWAMPAGDDRESLFESYPIVMNFVRDKGWRFTGRSHIMAFNTERCV